MSAGYAELLLAADPENIELRSELVEMLIERGEFSRALKHLADWQGGDEQARRFYNLVLDGRMATVRHDEQAILAARQRLAEFDLTGLSPDQQTQLADLALALGLPARAADLHLAMAQVEGPDQQAHQLAAARWYLAAEQPADAAVIYQQLAEQARTVEGRRQFALLAYNGFLAADQAAVASEYAVQLLDSGSLETLGDDWWLRSVQTAQGAMRFDLATRLAEHWPGPSPTVWPPCKRDSIWRWRQATRPRPGRSAKTCWNSRRPVPSCCADGPVGAVAWQTRSGAGLLGRLSGYGGGCRSA
ncbi:hypothetical protein ULF88_04775 [Halopseudomonas pachastrellae]|nr:hypothetical protein [Halopseudomonas pachastrellae]